MNAIVAALLFASLFQTDVKTVWDGVYTADQGARGKAVFLQRCARCHGDNLQGGQSPPLTTDRFIEHWREGAVEGLFNKISSSMPPGGGEGITQSNYVDIVSAILQANGFPAGGQELVRDDLRKIQIINQDGPKPVPNNSLVQAIGCLSQNQDDTWALTDVAEPVRNRLGDETTPDELKAAEAARFGPLAFRLQNMEVIGFNPTTHKGHKMLVKGVIFRSATNSRINVTAIGLVGDICNPK